MRKILTAFTGILAACGTPAYRAPEVPVPSTYSVGGEASNTTPVGGAVRDTSYGVPASSVRVSTTLASTPFWTDLGDTTLTMLIRESERANLDVRIAQSRLMGARAVRRLVSYDLVPTITGTGSTSRQQFSVAQTPGLTRQLPAQQLWDVGFDASWEMDFFGRVGRTVRAQGALAESSQYGLQDVQVSVAAEVARTYFDLRGAQRQLAVSERNATNQRKIVKLTEDRLAAGKGTAFDTERAKSVLYLTLAATPGLESQIALDRNRLAVLLGRVPDALTPILLGSGALLRLPDTLYVGSPDQLVHRRPDVLRAERQLAASSLFVGAARADYLPRVTLLARAGYAANSADSLFKRGTSRLLLGPVLTFPLFDVGRVRERVQVARAGQDEAQATYNATVLQALEESEGSLVTYDRAHARLAILELAVRSSSLAADLAQQRFEAGLTDFLQVLDAERTLLDAENQLELGRTAAATALVAVYKAVGGTWPLR
jgi:NodT family efflux transporter outer membrane factor (OMF) lipoprotein